jgi:glutathione peroxidase
MTDRIVSLLLPALGLLLAVPCAAAAADAPAPKKPASVLDFQVKDIDGKTVDLGKYRGEVLLVVNTASFCGYTPQYKELEAAFEKYKGRGFEVLAFPANEFGHQEPKADPEIKEFCTSKYNVTFPLFSKIVVKGEGIHPLYQYLTGTDTDPKFAGPIGWNFAKFLVNRKGEVVARFKSDDTPDSEKVTKAIEGALAEPK